MKRPAKKQTTLGPPSKRGDAPRIYLAGPEVFLSNASLILDQKKEMCAKNGFEGVCPFDVEASVSNLPKSKAGIQIGQNNEKLIESCAIVIANLTPFRGLSADVGTVYECGFARARGLVVFGYTHSTLQYFARTVAWLKDSVRKGKDGRYRDANGMAIENFDLSDNLMIPAGIAGSGGKVIVTRVPKSKWFTSLYGFELCLKMAKKVPDRISTSRERA